jgi:large subunit ribosomal protein L25
MAEAKTLAATVRSGIGKGASRSVRREGRIPAVIYGGGDPAQPISLDYREVNKLIYAGHFLTTIFEIEVGGTKQRVIPRDYQLDRVEDHPLHVDFLRLKEGATLRVAIPVHFTNQDVSPGLKKGGSLNIVAHTIELKVPADAIPEAVIVDLSHLDMAESLHISTVTLPEGCRPVITNRDFTIVTIVPPLAAIEAETPTPTAEAAATAAAATAASATTPAPDAAAAAAAAPAPAAKGKSKK